MKQGTVQQLKSVDSKVFQLQLLFSEKFTVDFYQREYVWEKKQLEDLINDLSNVLDIYDSRDGEPNSPLRSRRTLMWNSPYIVFKVLR